MIIAYICVCIVDQLIMEVYALGAYLVAKEAEIDAMHDDMGQIYIVWGEEAKLMVWE